MNTESFKIYKIGGCVRDYLLNRPSHDVDYVVVGATIEQMLSLGYKQVGKDFPVFLHPKTGEEYALARKEVTIGPKYTDFKFVFTPDITLEEDCIRRDLTINALCQDMHTGEIVDFFNGQEDLKNKTLRHVSKHFVEDPLRVLRVARFKAQLDFDIATSTRNLCRMMKSMLTELTPERVWKETEKALHTFNFADYIEGLEETYALPIIMDEVAKLQKVPERLDYHPEKNAYKHVLLCLKQVADMYVRFNTTKPTDWDEVALLNFGLLCHDLGKVCTENTWPKHPNHEILGLDVIDGLCDRLKIPNEYKAFAKLACRYHMKFYTFLDMSVKKQYDMLKAITNNFREYKPLQLLIQLHACDLYGRKGEISEERIKYFNHVLDRVKTIYNIMEGKTLKDLPNDTQENLAKHKGEQFGKLYRDAMISYLKHGLQTYVY